MVIQARWTVDRPRSTCVVSLTVHPDLRILSDEGLATPDGLLSASLAASATLRMARFARRARLDIRAVQVEVSHARSQSGRMLTMAISAVGSLTNRQQQGLLRVADRCPVHKALTGRFRVVILERFPGA
jgi:putative redox protein